MGFIWSDPFPEESSLFLGTLAVSSSERVCLTAMCLQFDISYSFLRSEAATCRSSQVLVPPYLAETGRILPPASSPRLRGHLLPPDPTPLPRARLGVSLPFPITVLAQCSHYNDSWIIYGFMDCVSNQIGKLEVWPLSLFSLNQGLPSTGLCSKFIK